MYRHASLLLASLGLAACSGNYSFNSNLDKENFENYVPAAKVQVVERDQFDPLNAESLGTVEGLSCQLRSHEAPPHEVDARNDARAQAAALGADTIVFQQCFEITELQGCLAAISCFGSAYKTLEQE